MRKWLLFVCLIWILSITPASAQQCTGVCVYLPLVVKESCGGTMSNFKVVVGESTTNQVLNPSAETTGNFTAEAGTTVTRSTTYQKYGLYSYRVETSADNEGVEITLSTLTNAIHYVTMLVRGTIPAAWDWSLDDATYTSPTLVEQIDSNWALYGLQFPAAQANASVKLSIHQNGAGSGDFYLDGIQVEAKEYWTTYCDGNQEGCAWSGAENASTSTRSAASRAGGRVQDLEDDYFLNVGGIVGGAAPPQSLGIDSYAILPGGELNSIKVNSRTLTITGVISASSDSDFHEKQADLLAVLKGENYPNNQPVRIRYEGATVHKEIELYYESGLEGELQATIPCWEKVAVRFIAPDPFWKEIGESAALLDTEDSATFRVVAGRLKSTGQWSVLGPPNAAGTYTTVTAVAEDEVYVYFGGNFANFDNIANADNIVRYNKQTGAYSALDVGLNGTVSDMAIAPNGDLYIVGAFTNAGGVAAADHITRWDGSNFNAVGIPNQGAAAFTLVSAIAIDRAGIVFIGGLFSNWADIANADNIVSWDGSTYSALSTGTNGAVSDIAIGLDNTPYITGSFTTAGGTSANRIASWSGSAFSALSTGLDASGNCLAVDPNTGFLYVGGTFTAAGATSASMIAGWNGTQFFTLGSGANDSVESLAVGADGSLYAIGDFTSIGGLALTNRVARWNGYAWGHFDIQLPGTPSASALLTSKFYDPVIKQKFDIYIGFDTDGTGTYAGLVSPDNEGKAQAFPKIVFSRSGGTSATIATLKNETTGKEILFDYDLQDGETLTVDLTPGNKKVTSSFLGSVPGAILANSDNGIWSLLPGSQDITSFVIAVGGPTVTGYMLWREAYSSY